MARSYTRATPEFMEMLSEVLDSHRDDLSDVSLDVTCASKLSGTGAIAVRKANASERREGIDLSVVYSGEVFANVSRAQALALIDDALADYVGVPKRGKDGEVTKTVYKRKAPIRIHPEVIKRHGLVLANWNKAVEALGQMDLFDEPTDLDTVRRRKKADVDAPRAAEG